MAILDLVSVTFSILVFIQHFESLFLVILLHLSVYIEASIASHLIFVLFDVNVYPLESFTCPGGHLSDCV